MEETKQTVLVTGATGFLGRRLCERLREEGEPVVALGRHKAEGPWDRFVECDLSREAVPPADVEDVGTIYHLASPSCAGSENGGRSDALRPVIVEGTRRLLEAAGKAGVPRFIYLSSVKAMGAGNPAGIEPAPMDENWPHTPQGPYGMAKAEAEELVRSAGLAHAVILRPVMPFGHRAKGDLPRMVEAVRRGRFPPIPETGNRWSMIHVDDIIEYCLRAAIRPIAAGKTYILAGPETASTRQLYDAIRDSLGLGRREWSVPLALLQMAATTGSVAGFILGKRLPFDREALRQLTGSAWYSAKRAETELEYHAIHPILQWLHREAT